MSKYKVRIEIVGGVPKILECPPEVDVEIKQVNAWQRWREEQKLNKERSAQSLGANSGSYEQN
jgi:hypothetical protein